MSPKTRAGEARLPVSYILPIRRQQLEDTSELAAYLGWLDERLELIVVDGSPPAVFQGHAWPGRRLAPDPARHCANGKVQGVLTGLDVASHDKVIIADDDVRYDHLSLMEVVRRLDFADVVRPQNYFEPLPWHAIWDSARSLINRATGGDWPGTLAVRRSLLQQTSGYDGDCLFENLELVRTVVAAGGQEHLAEDIYIRRLPPTTKHFLSQRVRQAYDEFARPQRLMLQLAILPATIMLWRRNRYLPSLVALASVAVSEAGRRKRGGTTYVPPAASLMAPLWLTERMLCSWVALLARFRGGVRYGNGRLVKAASKPGEINRGAKATEVVYQAS